MREEVAEEEAEDILKDIRSLLQKEREERGNAFEIIYPPEGGEKTITETLEINVYTGDAYADGVEGHLSNSLRSVGMQYAQSVVIDADNPIVVQLDDGGKRTVDADKIYAKSHTKFQRVLIEVSKSTKIKFWASTNPDASLEFTKARSVLILKDSKFNTSVTADTNIFSPELSPSYSVTLFRIYACFSAAGVLSVKRTKSGVTVTEKLNSANQLTTDASYSFDIVVESGETINLQYDATATARKLSVAELGGGT